jgi:hypothetical protein
MGVRNNDVGGYQVGQLTELASIHENPYTQNEHCLRSPSQDGQTGDLEALADCRAFIQSELAIALGDGSTAALQTMETQTVGLSYSTNKLSVSRYAFHLGRAMHALEDSFAHTYRSDDMVYVRNVVNYIDLVDSPSYSPQRDGFPHRSDLDYCEKPSDRARADAASSAAAALAAALPGGGDATGRIDAVLDRWLTYDPACNASDSPCAPPASLGCSSAPSSSHLMGLGFLFLLGAWTLRRSKRTVLSAGLLCTMLLVGSSARADEAADLEFRKAHPWFITASGGFSVDQGGLHVGVGAARRFNDAFRLGIRAEYNPWFDLGTARISPGSANVFLTGTWSWFRARGFTLSSSLSLGMSVLLFELVGGPAGSVGPYLGLCPIAVTIPLNQRMGLNLGTEVGVARPDLSGVPIVSRQYRFTVTWEYAF